MPRVTEVLDHVVHPQLANWFKNNSKMKCERIAEETARIGKTADSLIQQDVNEGGYVPPEDDEQVMNCLKGWETIKKEHPSFVGSITEMQTELKYGGIVGHPDYINKEERGWGITDLKCTSGIRMKNWIQIAMYAQMHMHIKNLEFPFFIRIIRLNRDGAPPEWLEITEPSYINYCMEQFYNYLSIFNSEEIMKEHFRQQLEEELLS